MGIHGTDFRNQRGVYADCRIMCGETRIALTDCITYTDNSCFRHSEAGPPHFPDGVCFCVGYDKSGTSETGNRQNIPTQIR
jgi:hypothetical protein